MAKPASPYTWATTGGTRIAPSAPKQAAGFVVSERPAAREFNAIVGSALDWVGWLNSNTFDAAIASRGVEDAVNRAVSVQGYTTSSQITRTDQLMGVNELNKAAAAVSNMTLLASFGSATVQAQDCDPATGRIVGVGDNQISLSADFGRTVSNPTPGLDPSTGTTYVGKFHDVLWVARLNLWVACGSNGTSDSQIQTSPTGSTWTSRESGGTTGDLLCLVDSGTQLLALGGGLSGAKGFTSTDGLSWSAVTVDTTTSDLQVMGCVYDGTAFVGVIDSSAGAAARATVRSTNGTSWTSVALGSTEIHPDTVCVGQTDSGAANGMILVGGRITTSQTSDRRVYMSTDHGVTFSLVYSSPTGGAQRLLALPHGFVALSRSTLRRGFYVLDPSLDGFKDLANFANCAVAALGGITGSRNVRLITMDKTLFVLMAGAGVGEMFVSDRWVV